MTRFFPVCPVNFIILEQDLLVLFELLHAIKDCDVESDNFANIHINDACCVTTQAQAKVGLQPLPDLDDTLLQGETKGPGKTWQQLHITKYLDAPVPESSTEVLKVSV